MLSIIINSIVLLGTITIISYIDDFCEKYNISDSGKDLLKTLGIVLCCSSACNMAATLAYGSGISYIIYTIDRFLRIVFLLRLITVASSQINVSKSIVSNFISFASFASTFLYFVDTLVCKGVLDNNLFGVFIASDLWAHKILYYLVYLVFLFYILGSEMSSLKLRRKKPERVYLYSTFLFVFLGLVADLCALNNLYYLVIPHTVFDFLALVFVFKLVFYHRSIQVMEADYADILSHDKVDVVFVLDDKQNVVFQSKRAEVLGTIVDDSYVGRNFFEIFDFSDEKKNEILNLHSEDPIGSDAIYKKLSKSVNFLIQNRLDIYGDVLSTAVRVFNMETKEMEDDIYDQTMNCSADRLENLVDDAIELTSGVNLLLVDGENSDFSKQFDELSHQYEINDSITFDYDNVDRMLEEKDYDIIFISDLIPEKGAFSLSKKIRNISDGRFKDIPIILVTSSDINNVFLDMLEAEFTDYIYNPLDNVQFDSCIKRWLTFS